MDQTFRYQIAACSQSASRKRFFGCHLISVTAPVLHESQTTPVAEENHNSDAFFELDIHFSAQELTQDPSRRAGHQTIAFARRVPPQSRMLYAQNALPSSVILALHSHCSLTLLDLN
jgi:hypothetical protein